MTTIREIAKTAGVSVSTASIVLRGEAETRKISSETARKVQETAQTLGYTPNVSARRLRAQNTGSLVISVFWATFWASEFRAPTLQFLRGLQNALDETDTKCEIVINQYDRGHIADSLPLFSLCHAAIVCNATPADIETLRAAKLPVPVVLHSRDTDALPCVYVDYTDAGAIPARVFDSRSLKRAVLVASSAPFQGADVCENAFIKGAVMRGMSVQRLQVEHTMRGGCESALQIAAMPVRPDCVFFLSDVLALGALKGFHQAGVSIPQDISLMSLGSYDADMEEYASPSLSVVQIPLEKMGAECLRKAIRLIQGGENVKRRTNVPVVYVPRESCGEEIVKECSKNG